MKPCQAASVTSQNRDSGGNDQSKENDLKDLPCETRFTDPNTFVRAGGGRAIETGVFRRCKLVKWIHKRQIKAVKNRLSIRNDLKISALRILL